MAEGKELVISISYSNGVATVTTDDEDVQGFPKTYHAQGKHEPYSYCKSVASQVERETRRKVRYEITAINGQPPVPPKRGILSRHAVPIAILSTSGVICLVLCLFAYSIEATEASRSLYSASSSHITSSSSLRSVETEKEYEKPRTDTTIFEFGDGYNDSNSLYNRFVGTVTNVSNETRYFVQVRGSFKDEDGNTIDTDWTYACGAEGLRPGESTKFTLSVQKDSRIKRISYDIFDYK